MAPATRWHFRKWAKNDTWLLIANELMMEHRLKVDKNPLPTVAIIDSQSVKNSATATKQIGFDGGKLIKGRKRFLMVSTMGHLLWVYARPMYMMGKRMYFCGSKRNISTHCWMICCWLLYPAKIIG